MIASVVVAMAMPSLDLKPGIPLPPMANLIAEPSSGQAPSPGEFSISNLWKAILSICVILTLIYNAYQLLRKGVLSWGDVLKSFFYIGLFLLIMVIIIIVFLSFPNSSPQSASAELPPPAVAQPGPPLGPLPATLIWIAGLSLVALFVGVGLWLFFRPEKQADQDPLTVKVEWALRALQEGLEFRNVIMRCYWQMEQVLREGQGIEMGRAMTVREFERLLEARGVPHPPVHQLTQLFEKARYGYRETSADDERRAVDALTAIVHYSRTKRPSLSS
jgi:hypothetical protein